MSERDVEIATKLLEAVNRLDKPAYLAACDPEIEWTPPAEWPESGAITGAEPVWEFIVSLAEPWEQGEYELGDLIDPDGGNIVALLRREMRGKASGVVADFEYWTVVTVRDGRITRCQWFSDRTSALEAGAAGS